MRAKAAKLLHSGTAVGESRQRSKRTESRCAAQCSQATNFRLGHRRFFHLKLGVLIGLGNLNITRRPASCPARDMLFEVLRVFGS